LLLANNFQVLLLRNKGSRKKKYLSGCCEYLVQTVYQVLLEAVSYYAIELANSKKVSNFCGCDRHVLFRQLEVRIRAISNNSPRTLHEVRKTKVRATLILQRSDARDETRTLRHLFEFLSKSDFAIHESCTNCGGFWEHAYKEHSTII
jgi:hypothetical protein